MTISSKTRAEGSRTAAGNPRPINAAAAMKAGFIVSPIIRGFTLRTLGDSAVGITAGIRDMLHSHLKELQSNNDAKTAAITANTVAIDHNRPVARLPAMIEHLPDAM